jgi:hypothetical protein
MQTILLLSANTRLIRVIRVSFAALRATMGRFKICVGALKPNQQSDLYCTLFKNKKPQNG